MFRNLIFFIGGITVFILLVFIVNFIKKNTEDNIDYATCEPIGLYSNYQFENNKDKFLIHQITELSSSLIYFENDMIKTNCISSTNIKECIDSMTKRKKEISKCIRTYERLFNERD